MQISTTNSWKTSNLLLIMSYNCPILQNICLFWCVHCTFHWTSYKNDYFKHDSNPLLIIVMKKSENWRRCKVSKTSFPWKSFKPYKISCHGGLGRKELEKGRLPKNTQVDRFQGDRKTQKKTRKSRYFSNYTEKEIYLNKKNKNNKIKFIMIIIIKNYFLKKK